jgi:hypothetical protein
MPKIKDATPIPIVRTNRTNRIEIFLNADGSINLAMAHRYTHMTQAGVGVIKPTYVGAITIQSASITTAIANKIADLDALFDAADTL